MEDWRERLRRAIAGKAVEIERLFSQIPLVTVVVRCPWLEDGDVVVTSEDDTEQPIAAVRRLYPGSVDPLAFAELRDINVKRCTAVFHPLRDWSPTDWACALAGEAGEACNEVKKLRRLDGADAHEDTAARRSELETRIGAELADTVIYADLLAARLGIDLGAAIREKFNEVSERRGSDIRLPARPAAGRGEA